jgi:hypothetical protein
MLVMIVFTIIIIITIVTGLVLIASHFAINHYKIDQKFLNRDSSAVAATFSANEHLKRTSTTDLQQLNRSSNKNAYDAAINPAGSGAPGVRIVFGKGRRWWFFLVYCVHK